ncbi:Uncharacterized protein A9P81_2874 [Leptospira interrogans serovar Copenhageni/Icterohaemorrhagiae]|nr:Uncharacterized protein A9P81_2874 [Leptospira interrogans serovar Copenhageni/Icterohaemorrhagiae]
MNKILEELKDRWLRILLSLLVSTYLFYVSIYPELFKSWNLIVQIIATLVIGFLNLLLAAAWDVVSIALKNQLLNIENIGLRSELENIEKLKGAELSDLKKVIVNFLEHSYAYQEKVLKYLKMKGRFLCVTKSSEGLSDVFNQLPEPKPQLPFSKVLSDLPGSIKPFERMNIHFIPLENLKNFNELKIKDWIDKNIIPKVFKERETFLSSLDKSIRSLAGEFSYKYVAFVVERDSMEYETKNRKFNRDFISIFIGKQDKQRTAKLAKDLVTIIRAKEFFQLVDWSAFVDLNPDQKKIFEEKKNKLYSELSKRELHRFSDIAQISEQDLTKIIFKAFGNKTTQKKANNIAKKIKFGTGQVSDVLRKSGISI